MAAQPLRPDLAYAPPKFVFAGLAASSLPAIFDGAVKDAPEEWHLVEKQTFDGMQRCHEFESGANSKHSGVEFAEPAERAVLSPGHHGAMVIPDQKISVGADRTYRRGEVYASADVWRATEDFAEQAGVDRRPIDGKNLVGILIDRKRGHDKGPTRAKQVKQQLDHFAGAQGNVVELVPRRLDPKGSSARHPQIDQLLPQVRDREWASIDLLCEPQFLLAQKVTNVASSHKLLGLSLIHIS